MCAIRVVTVCYSTKPACNKWGVVNYPPTVMPPAPSLCISVHYVHVAVWGLAGPMLVPVDLGSFWQPIWPYQRRCHDNMISDRCYCCPRCAPDKICSSIDSCAFPTLNQCLNDPEMVKDMLSALPNAHCSTRKRAARHQRRCEPPFTLRPFGMHP